MLPSASKYTHEVYLTPLYSTLPVLFLRSVSAGCSLQRGLYFPAFFACLILFNFTADMVNFTLLRTGIFCTPLSNFELCPGT